MIKKLNLKFKSQNGVLKFYNIFNFGWENIFFTNYI